MKPLVTTVLLLSVAASAAAAAPVTEDRTELDRTPIVGNRELPKVLYIVPWKKPVPGAQPLRAGPPPAADALSPVDRDVLRRQLRLAVPPPPAPESRPPGQTPANVPGDRP
ncbi:MAG: hypothetical protein U1F21_18420 [Sphaerotilus natans]